jgi:hypothetical protein
VAYVDPATILTTDPGDVLTAAWCDTVRDDLEFIIDPPQCSVYASSAQTVANNSTVTLTANSENYDNDSMHSTVTNNSRITFQTAGRYEIFANVEYAADADGYRRLSFLFNGATSYGGQTVYAAPTVATRLSAQRSIIAAAGQYVEVQVAHTAGADLSVTLDEFRAKFESR